MAYRSGTGLRIWKDKTARSTMCVLTFFFLALALIIAIGLYVKSMPLLKSHSLIAMLTSHNWHPMKGEFGLFPFIMGTLWVTGIAISIALPLSLLSSIYLSEYAPRFIQRIAYPFVDLLSGIPPVVYGVWGLLVIVPFVSGTIAPHFDNDVTGYSILSGGIVLALMVTPLLISILVDLFKTVPGEMRSASLSLGATTWQTIKFVILRKSMPGIIAAVVLAISRAFGETIAVMMVCGNLPKPPHSALDAGYPLPALIANNYGEMASVPLYESALMFAALILFVIIFAFNTASRFILNHIERKFAL